MRVISGTCKGRALKAVPGNTTRPTTDKVKEAVFNMIGPYFEGGIALDLFAGSGGLGIEALSRGLDKVIFVDRDSKAIQTIYENLNFCQLEGKAEVFRNDADRALKALIKREMSFDYIFLDPPYKLQQLTKLMQQIDDCGLIHNKSLIVCEHSHEVVLPSKLSGLSRLKHEKYGIISISIFSKGTGE